MSTGAAIAFKGVISNHVIIVMVALKAYTDHLKLLSVCGAFGPQTPSVRQARLRSGPHKVKAFGQNTRRGLWPEKNVVIRALWAQIRGLQKILLPVHTKWKHSLKQPFGYYKIEDQMLFVIQREPVSQISSQFEVFAFSGQYIFATTVNIYHPIKYY